MSESIRVFASATVANVACGFDILGFAVNAPGDEVILKKKNTPGVTISQITGDGGRLSLNSQENTVGVAVLQYLNKIGSDQGIDITLHKKMPFGSGLGSSAASAVAGAFAINELLGGSLSTEELLPFAIEGERIACGSAHADNVAPSLFGGFVLIRSYQPLDVVRINTPPELYCAIIHPQIEVPTKEARNILKKNIRMEDAITQWGNVAGLIAGLMQSDYALIGRSLQDVIVEPVRSILIPGFEKVKQASLQTGALGCGISGSGPSIFSLCRGQETAVQVGKAKQQIFEQLGIGCEVYTSQINQQGPVILE
ncbi:homoserine kinase [Rapidithrix thailandica]|uniref:Homoserine kinase n=1 Tax=Rapidithrix thailandica TaxID=413964 RepID=A0AAW9RZP3_9BACT